MPSLIASASHSSAWFKKRSIRIGLSGVTEMHVKGLMNMQYAIEKGKVYVLEANPRASRTVPLVSKVCNIRMVPLATDIITSEITSQ